MPERFDVLLFAPEPAPHGARMRAHFEGEALVIEMEKAIAVPSTEIKVSRGGFDHRQLFLSWPREGHTWSVSPADDAALNTLIAAAPPCLQPQLADWTQSVARHRRGSRFGWSLLTLFLAAPLLLLMLFWLNADQIAGWAAARVPPEMEQRLGDLAFAQMKPGLKLLEQGSAVEMVGEVGARLTEGSRYRYQWHVAESPEVNAFALPGGRVVVFTGLIRATDSAEEVAGVLAHEASHVELRHSLKNMIHALGWRGVLAVALGDVSGGVWANMAAELGSLKYGRDLESEADKHGLLVLKKTGIAPQGLQSFFQKLSEQEGVNIALLSSHPATAERVDEIRKLIADEGRYAVQPLGYDWEAIQRSLEE
jgi:beta-barrel assembly-enhancing protease